LIPGWRLWLLERQYMKVTSIVDNETWQPGLEAAWGFSCLVPELVGKVYQVWKPEEAS